MSVYKKEEPSAIILFAGMFIVSGIGFAADLIELNAGSSPFWNIKGWVILLLILLVLLGISIYARINQVKN